MTTVRAPGVGFDDPHMLDSAYAWLRLALSVALTAISSIGMWSIMVALPTVQADFGVARAEAAAF